MMLMDRVLRSMLIVKKGSFAHQTFNSFLYKMIYMCEIADLYNYDLYICYQFHLVSTASNIRKKNMGRVIRT